MSQNNRFNLVKIRMPSGVEKSIDNVVMKIENFDGKERVRSRQMKGQTFDVGK